MRIEEERDTRAINFCCVWDLYFNEAVLFAGEIFSPTSIGFFANLTVQQITTLKINILGHVPGNVPSWRMTTARSALLLVLASS